MRKTLAFVKLLFNRIGNVGKLRVKKLTGDAEERTTFAPATHIRLDVESDTQLYVGGLPQGYLVSLVSGP